MDAYLPPSGYHVFVPQKQFELADVRIVQGAAPEWAEPLEVPEPPEAQIYQGTGEVLLFDVQFNPDAETTYYHFASRLLNEQDLREQGTLSIDFDPSHEMVVLHSCDVLRNGRRLNRLNLERTPAICQREMELEGSIYSGELSALFIVDDLREGDILEYSYSKVGCHYVFHQFFIEMLPLQLDVPVARFSYRIIKPQEMQPQIYHFPEYYSRHLIETEDEWIWLQEPAEPFIYDVDLPQDAISPAFAVVSNADWRQIVQRFAPLFALDPEFGQDWEIKALIERWKAEEKSPEGRATLAARFVQDEIRYLCFTEEEYGYRPIDPLFTFKNRFGDCKSKSQLLKSLLHLLGISSDVVLVNSHGFAKHELPGLYFNHMITKVNLPNRSVFVETTQPYQGGDIFQSFPHFGLGLVCNEKTEGLELIHATRNPIDRERIITLHLYRKPQSLFSGLFSHTQEELPPSTIEIVEKRYGDLANWLRHDLRTLGQAAAGEEANSSYATIFEDLSLLEEEFEDDRSTNCVVYKTLWGLNDPDNFEFFMPTSFTTLLFQEIPEGREEPYYFGRCRTYKETLNLPGLELTPSEQTIEHEVFTFKRKDSQSKEGAKIEYELIVHQENVEQEAFDSLREALEDACERAIFSLTDG